MTMTDIRGLGIRESESWKQGLMNARATRHDCESARVPELSVQIRTSSLGSELGAHSITDAPPTLHRDPPLGPDATRLRKCYPGDKLRHLSACRAVLLLQTSRNRMDTTDKVVSSDLERTTAVGRVTALDLAVVAAGSCFCATMSLCLLSICAHLTSL